MLVIFCMNMVKFEIVWRENCILFGTDGVPCGRTFIYPETVVRLIKNRVAFL
jgi:hypothetical protein